MLLNGVKYFRGILPDGYRTFNSLQVYSIKSITASISAVGAIILPFGYRLFKISFISKHLTNWFVCVEYAHDYRKKI